MCLIHIPQQRALQFGPSEAARLTGARYIIRGGNLMDLNAASAIPDQRCQRLLNGEDRHQTYRLCSIKPSSCLKKSSSHMKRAVSFSSRSFQVCGCSDMPPPVSLIVGFFSYNSQSTNGRRDNSMAAPRPPGPPPIMATFTRFSCGPALISTRQERQRKSSSSSLDVF